MADLHVGIIFYHGTLHIDSTPATDAVHYGDLMTHEKGHPDYWEELKQRAVVPSDVEYDEVPRGRVTYAPKLGRALLFLDGCILIRPDLVIQIRKAMHLPPGAATEVRGDITSAHPVGAYPKMKRTGRVRPLKAWIYSPFVRPILLVVKSTSNSDSRLRGIFKGYEENMPELVDSAGVSANG